MKRLQALEDSKVRHWLAVRFVLFLDDSRIKDLQGLKIQTPKPS